MAGLVAMRGVPTAEAAESTITMMTRNLYVGVDLFSLYRADTVGEMRSAANTLFRQYQDHPYEARMDAVAGEIETAAPEVIGIQEAARIQPATDDHPTVDLLELLVTALDDRGLAFDIVASTATTNIEVPVEDDDPTAVRVTDRVALLIDRSLDIEHTEAGTFDSVVRPLAGADISIVRGYCRADVTHGSGRVSFVTTHLESSDEEIRFAQAQELLDRLPTDLPLIVGGDFNSGPGGSRRTYDRLRTSLADAYQSSPDDESGYTCCHDADLQNEESHLERRIDAVLYRNGPEPVASKRVGAKPDERITVDWADEMVTIWPSDHAGVVATTVLPDTQPPPTTSPTPNDPIEDTPRATPHSPEESPGMSLLAGLLGIAGAGYLYHRRRPKPENAPDQEEHQPVLKGR